MSETELLHDIIALRPFVPALDLERSAKFYEALGFEVYSLGDAMAHVSAGRFAFLLQAYEQKAFAEQFVMHMLVQDVDAWWGRIAALDLAGKFGVPPPQPPRLEPWGLRVAYVFDPSGVLWHVAEDRGPDSAA